MRRQPKSTEQEMSGCSDRLRMFHLGVGGVEHILHGERGLKYFEEQGMTVVIHGPPGSGKTLFSLQAATRAASDGMLVFYLCKDTHPTILRHRVAYEFDYYDLPKNKRPQLFVIDEIRNLTEGGGRGVGVRNLLPLLPKARGGVGALIFVDFGFNTVPAAAVDRYSLDTSVFCGLARLQPNYADIFDSVRRLVNESAQVDSECPGTGTLQVMTVLDSLPPAFLDECVRIRTERDKNLGQDEYRGSIMFLVMESLDLPNTVVSAFPPDVQLTFGARSELAGMTTKTIRVAKSRFQRARGEQFPFVVRSKGSGFCPDYVQGHVDYGKGWAQRLDANMFLGAGVTVLPSIPSFSDRTTDSRHAPKRRAEPIRFFNTDGPERTGSLDLLTEPHGLESGGCTLVVTENRCHSMSLGLHYLLGQMGGREGARCESVLMVSFSMGISPVLHEIWRHAKLRHCLDGAMNSRADLDDLVGRCDCKEDATTRLFTIPLRRGLAKKPAPGCSVRASNWGPCLHVLVPGLVWCPQEEVLHRIDALLKARGHLQSGSEGCANCLAIGRVLVDRVSRITQSYPLIPDLQAFVSQLLQVSSLHGADVMLLDDTAKQVERTGHVESRWFSMSRNAIRLKRIPFQGVERVVFELLRASGRRILQRRPMELRLDPRPGACEEECDQLLLHDSFRGASGVFLGEGAPCAVVVDLPYDAPFTPLQRDFDNLSRNLKSLIPSANVNVVGPAERAGVNCALSTLATVSHNTCHVVSVDEVWLHSLLNSGSLTQFTIDELNRMVATRETESMRSGKELVASTTSSSKTPVRSLDEVAKQYVCPTHRIVDAKRRASGNLAVGTNAMSYAVPFRHNWGVLVVNRPSAERMKFAMGLAYTPEIGGDSRRVQHDILSQDHVHESPPIDGPQPHANPQTVLLWALLNIDRSAKSIRNVVRLVRTVPEIAAYIKDFVRVWSLVWGTCPSEIETLSGPHSTTVTWMSLVRFKEAFCDPVFSSREWLDARERSWSCRQQTDEASRWLATLFRLNYFDFARETDESVVSFFIEILLAHAKFDAIFRVQGDLLEFNDGDLLRDGICTALDVIWRLLSPSQRREVAIGHAVSRRADQEQRSRLDIKVDERQVSLFSRQWVSTVPDLDRDYDLRESFVLTPLPCGEDDGTSCKRDQHLLSATVKPGTDVRADDYAELSRVCRNKGPTVSGAWFLGALSGGNKELAVDVIKELVSPYHERERLGVHASPPVSTWLYAKDSDCATRRLPYADILGVIANNDGLRETTFFPFCRTRVRLYTSISQVLCELVRRAMAFGPAPSAARASSFAEVAKQCTEEIVEIQRGRG